MSDKQIPPTACVETSAETKQEVWMLAEHMNKRYFDNKMTSILVKQIAESNRHLITFAKSLESARQAQKEHLQQYHSSLIEE